MYEIKEAAMPSENFFAGNFSVIPDFGKIKSGAAIRKYAPIIQGENGIEEAAAGTLDKLIGIAADEPNGENIVYYRTGEFFTQSLVLPDGVTAENLKPAFCKQGIFLKEMN